MLARAIRNSGAVQLTLTDSHHVLNLCLTRTVHTDVALEPAGSLLSSTSDERIEQDDQTPFAKPAKRPRFVDRLRVVAEAGRGGNGCVSFWKSRAKGLYNDYTLLLAGNPAGMLHKYLV